MKKRGEEREIFSFNLRVSIPYHVIPKLCIQLPHENNKNNKYAKNIKGARKKYSHFNCFCSVLIWQRILKNWRNNENRIFHNPVNLFAMCTKRNDFSQR